MTNRLDRARLLHLGLGRGDADVYRFGVDRPFRDAGDYLGYEHYRHVVRPALNQVSLHALTENKWIFYRLMHGFGVPVPRTLGLYDPVFGCTWDGRQLRTASEVLQLVDQERPAGLVLKPAGGQMGHDLLILDRIDYSTGRGTSRTGEPMTVREAVDALPVRVSRGYPGHILQEVLDQHQMLADLAPQTANTVRVVTLLTADDVMVLGTVLRLGRAGNMADNWEQGGICVKVDSETGVLGRGVLKPKHGGSWTSTHPDTGVAFTGQRLPYWKEVIDLCRHAARLLPGIRSVGWDVLLTGGGPILIEANGDWDLRLIQVHTAGMLADPVFRGELERAGVALPQRPLSAIRVGRTVARATMDKARRTLAGRRQAV